MSDGAPPPPESTVGSVTQGALTYVIRIPEEERSWRGRCVGGRTMADRTRE